MKIFVTGATGFIGKHLVTKLDAEGNKITINLRAGKRNPFQSDIKTYNLGERNIETDIQFFKEESFDGIIHLASLYITTHKPKDINRLIDSNIKFGTYILECAAQAKIKWFINTGTFWQHYENAVYSPVNLYAATKQAFENIAQFYIETNRIKFCTIKLSDTYGVGDTRSKIFNIWEKIAKTGETLDMSLGDQVMDISYIDDIVDAFILLIDQLVRKKKQIKNGSSFAVKAHKRYTLKELAKIFQECTNLILNINWGARSYREREVMVPWESGMVVPGWKPKITITEGIKLIFKNLK